METKLSISRQSAKNLLSNRIQVLIEVFGKKKGLLGWFSNRNSQYVETIKENGKTFTRYNAEAIGLQSVDIDNGYIDPVYFDVHKGYGEIHYTLGIYNRGLDRDYGPEPADEYEYSFTFPLRHWFRNNLRWILENEYSDQLQNELVRESKIFND